MNAAVNSIIARCLMDPYYLQEIKRDRSSALREYALDTPLLEDFQTFDASRCEIFGGFITKVQLNQLWEVIPYTRLLLSLSGLEPKIFVAYRNSAPLPTKRVSRDQKTALFLDFLATYLRRRRRERFQALLTLLMHERTVWAIGKKLLTSVSEDRKYTRWKGKEIDSAVPRTRGVLALVKLAHDPFEIVSRLRQDERTVPMATKQLTYFAYSADPTRMKLQILRLEKLTWLILSHVDGRKDVMTILRRVAPHQFSRLLARDGRIVFRNLRRSRVIELGRATTE